MASFFKILGLMLLTYVPLNAQNNRPNIVLILADDLGLPVKFNVLPTIIRQKGYNTALIGEWHLGEGEAYRPGKHGFDYTTPHTPLQTADDFREDPITMGDWRKGDKSHYTKMIEDMDDGIGRILNKLKECGFEQNTIVIFFLDNGPTTIGRAGPFTGNKGHVYEGGIRVPCIIRWPGQIQPVSVSHQSFISMDIAASIAAIVQNTPKQSLDGIDLIGHLISGAENFDRDLFWRKKRGQQVLSAVRSGAYKYIREESDTESKEYLFELANDPGETNNRVQDMPAKLSQLKQLLADWEAEVQPERFY